MNLWSHYGLRGRNRVSVMRFFPGIVILTVLVGCSGVRREPIQVDLSACPKQTVAVLMVEQNRLGPSTDSRALFCAINNLRDARNISMRSSALASRLCLNLAERETNPDKREKYAADGVDFAETALAQGGESDGAVHYYLAANLGLAVREHITLAMESLGRLEAEMKQAVALSPGIDEGGPLRLLGALYLKAPAWPKGIGDLDKALEILKQAVDQYPKHPLNHLFYAQALWEDGEDVSQNQAKAEFALGEKLLAEGEWGYNKQPWEKEFSEFSQEYTEIDSSVK